ncbi:hypothetical protein DL764_009073 [Monosporascus ibericus]|uniref:AA1-like domain-containing protein n=1 Tax=Monosporascus ibericus TaxID=155417 RepID=A0A4Q4SYV1_9PEZI|nr:hypothetical protein DL764_009073 [Monosporascus ibericus]
MQLISVLAVSASLVMAAMAAPSNMIRGAAANETRRWKVSDLEIRHQTGLPSTIRFHVRDETAAASLEPTLCEHYSFDDTVTTIIDDVYQVSCGNSSWSFNYVSIENDDPSKSPIGGKLTVQQITYPIGQRIAQAFRGSYNFHEDDFKRTERFNYYSALVSYTGDNEFTIEGTV